MAIKRRKPEEIVVKLRQVEVLMGQGMPRIDAIRQISVTEQTSYRWKKKRDLVRHWFENNGRVRNGHGTTQGTEAATERERAPASRGF
jgi:hypothetical protein